MCDSYSTDREVQFRSPQPRFGDIRDDFDDDFAAAYSPMEVARRKLLGPGIALAVIGVLGILGALIGSAAVLLAQFTRAMGSNERLIIMIICLAALMLGAALFGAVLLAGINMQRLRHRGLALAGAFIVTGLALGGVYAVLFFPFGVWALVVLYQPDVRSAFAKA